MSRGLNPGHSSVRITTATTTAVKTKSGTLRRIIIGATAAGTITLNDGLGARAVLGASYPVGSYTFDIEFVEKIEVVTGAASDITVVYD